MIRCQMAKHEAFLLSRLEKQFKYKPFDINSQSDRAALELLIMALSQSPTDDRATNRVRKELLGRLSVSDPELQEEFDAQLEARQMEGLIITEFRPQATTWQH